MYTVILKRGVKADVIKNDETLTRATNRAHSLLELHGLKHDKLTYDMVSVFTVDASEYYNG